MIDERVGLVRPHAHDHGERSRGLDVGDDFLGARTEAFFESPLAGVGLRDRLAHELRVDAEGLAEETCDLFLPHGSVFPVEGRTVVRDARIRVVLEHEAIAVQDRAREVDVEAVVLCEAPDDNRREDAIDAAALQ